MKRYLLLVCFVVLVLTSCRASDVVESTPEVTTKDVVEEIAVQDEIGEVDQEDQIGQIDQEDPIDQSDQVDSAEDDEVTQLEDEPGNTLESELPVIDPVEVIIDGMTLEEKVAQVFYISLAEYKQLDQPPVGGVIYFTEDMTTAQEIRQETSQLQNDAKIPMFIGIDEEGGIVSRISGDGGVGGTLVPTPWKLSQIGDLEDVYTINSLIGREINALGFNMNFAPVGDVRTNIYNPIIGKRAYNEDAHRVAEYVTTAIEAYRDTSIIPVVKHFPGHGDTIGDSHLDSVEVEHDLDRLMSVEMLPFIAAVEADSEMIMVGHIKVPKVTEEDLPASLSEELIQGILVESLGYEGLIISDALNMKGITKHHSVDQVVALGIEAGMDMFLMPDDYQEAYDHLLQMALESEAVLLQIEASVYKIIELKMAKGILDKSQKQYELTELGSKDHQLSVDAIISE